MNWYVLQILESENETGVFLPKHSCFVLKSCTQLWKTHRVIVDELEDRGYMNCCLLQCTEEEMLALTTNENSCLRRRKTHNMGPFETHTLTQEQVDQLLILLHIQESIQVVRFLMEKGENVKAGEVMRGEYRGLKGTVVSDKANLRKFTPMDTLPGLKLLLLLPAALLKPLTKVEYESLKLKIDTSAKWYMVLCKNERTLQQAFKLTVRSRAQEGICTEELGLERYSSDMEMPQGISRRRYFYHIGAPFPKHYFFVYTTLADAQSCRYRNPYARMNIVWNRGYEPVALKNKDFQDLVKKVEGKEVELSTSMQRFIESLKTGDEVGFLLTNLQEIPTPAKVVRKKEKAHKIIVQDKEGRTYSVPENNILPKERLK